MHCQLFWQFNMSLLPEITIKKIGLPQRFCKTNDLRNKIGLPKIFCETKDLWEKVEEPKRVRWTKQRGDESAAVEKLSKRFTQIFRVPQTEEQAEKSLLFCKTKEQDQKALLRRGYTQRKCYISV